MVDLLGSNLAKVLMLLGVVVIGGIFIAASGSDKVGAQISDIQQLMAVAQARLGATPNGYTNFTTANAAALISSGVVPSGMAKTGNALRDRWGGAVALGNANNAAQGTITWWKPGECFLSAWKACRKRSASNICSCGGSITGRSRRRQCCQSALQLGCRPVN